MKTIHKFPLAIVDRQTIITHSGAEVLSVQVQKTIPSLWMLVDTEMPKEQMTIRIHGTGHEVFDYQNIEKFIGTIQLHKGSLVLHVFKEK